MNIKQINFAKYINIGVEKLLSREKIKENAMKENKPVRSTSEYKATDSRKYKLTLLIFAFSTLMCILPPIVSVFIFKLTIPGLVILSGAEWVSLMSVICGFYFGVNVWQKKIDGEVSISSNAHDRKKNEIKDTTLPEPPAPPTS